MAQIYENGKIEGGKLWFDQIIEEDKTTMRLTKFNTILEFWRSKECPASWGRVYDMENRWDKESYEEFFPIFKRRYVNMFKKLGTFDIVFKNNKTFLVNGEKKEDLRDYVGKIEDIRIAVNRDAIYEKYREAQGEMDGYKNRFKEVAMKLKNIWETVSINEVFLWENYYSGELTLEIDDKKYDNIKEYLLLIHEIYYLICVITK